MDRITTEFVTMAYNGEVVNRWSSLALNLGRCLIIAAFIDSQNGCSSQDYETIKKCGLMEDNLNAFIRRVNGLRNKEIKRISSEVMKGELNRGVIKKKNSIVNCDYYYKLSGIREERYSIDDKVHISVEERLRAEVLGNDERDETYMLMWLLKQSGVLNKVFSEDEMYIVEEKYRCYKIENRIPNMDLKGGNPNVLYTFSLLKKRILDTALVTSTLSRIPIFQRKKSLFIATDKYFSNSAERLAAVKKLVEEEHLSFQVEKEGEFAEIRIDGVLYEIVPDAIKAKYMLVHGVRLRKVA